MPQNDTTPRDSNHENLALGIERLENLRSMLDLSTDPKTLVDYLKPGLDGAIKKLWGSLPPEHRRSRLFEEYTGK